MSLGIGLKGRIFITVSLYQRVGMGPRNRNPEQLAGPHVASGIKPTNVGRPGPPQRGIKFLGAPGPKFHQQLITHHGLNPGSLGGNHNLEVNHV